MPSIRPSPVLAHVACTSILKISSLQLPASCRAIIKATTALHCPCNFCWAPFEAAAEALQYTQQMGLTSVPILSGLVAALRIEHAVLRELQDLAHLSSTTISQVLLPSYNRIIYPIPL